MLETTNFRDDVIDGGIWLQLPRFGPHGIVGIDPAEEMLVIQKCADLFPVEEIGLGKVDLFLGVPKEEQKVDQDLGVDDDAVFGKHAETLLHHIRHEVLLHLLKTDCLRPVFEGLLVLGLFVIDSLNLILFAFLAALLWYHVALSDPVVLGIDCLLLLSFEVFGHLRPGNIPMLLVDGHLLFGKRVQIFHVFVDGHRQFGLAPLSPGLSKEFDELFESFLLAAGQSPVLSEGVGTDSIVVL